MLLLSPAPSLTSSSSPKSSPKSSPILYATEALIDPVTTLDLSSYSSHRHSIPLLDELSFSNSGELDPVDVKLATVVVETVSPPASPQLCAAVPHQNHTHTDDLQHLDFGSLFSPVPSVALNNDKTNLAASDSIGLPSAIPGRNIPAAHSDNHSRQRRRSRLPSFFLRLTGRTPDYLETPHFHNNSTLSLSPATHHNRKQSAAGGYNSRSLPRDCSFDKYRDQASTLRNVVSHAPAATPAAPSRGPSRTPSVTSSNFSKRQNSLRRFASRNSSLDSYRSLNNSKQATNFPVIFRSTAACRLSVPIDALRSLQTISEHDISRKMHQTSSRLLRMTEDERPYTRDFKDLFSTLMVSLPLTPHRVRFQRIDHTFTSEEAITNLGSLKFSQSNRMPDPKDPSRIVTTTTTTTFSMAREMAKSVCQKFLEARFIESVDGKNDFSSKNAVWQLTPKGMHILQRFCNRNGINQRHVQLLLESPRNTMHLVLLERESDGDRIYRDQATIEVVFRRFVGQDGPNLKWSTANSDSDSVTDYQTGLIGVKMARERKIGDKTYWNTFTGKAAVDWLMDCCTMVDRRETIELAGLFVDAGLIHPVEGTVQTGKFSPLKTSIYYVTDKGQKVAGWIPSAPRSNVNGIEPTTQPRRTEGAGRDSNANRMTIIIRDPALRLLFREFLRDTHCEENLAFYLDVKEFLTNYHIAKRSGSSALRLDTIRETLAAAYSLYNAFLAPGSPCELNIDHSLRTALAGRMTRAVGDDEATITSLDEVAGLFDQAQTSVFKLMASDSVPKFMREPKYVPIIRERNLDVIIGGLNAAAPRP